MASTSTLCWASAPTPEDLKNGDLGSILSRKANQFAEPLTNALTGDVTSLVVNKLLTAAAEKIAKALPPGAGQVAIALEALPNGVKFLADKDNIENFKKLFQSSAENVRTVVDGVVGRPAGRPG